MRELLLDWVVVGQIRSQRYATFTKLKDALYYAWALGQLRGLTCKVVSRAILER